MGSFGIRFIRRRFSSVCRPLPPVSEASFLSNLSRSFLPPVCGARSCYSSKSSAEDAPLSDPYAGGVFSPPPPFVVIFIFSEPIHVHVVQRTPFGYHAMEKDYVMNRPAYDIRLTTFLFVSSPLSFPVRNQPGSIFYIIWVFGRSFPLGFRQMEHLSYSGPPFFTCNCESYLASPPP